jgi:hypothetical protein
MELNHTIQIFEKSKFNKLEEEKQKYQSLYNKEHTKSQELQKEFDELKQQQANTLKQNKQIQIEKNELQIQIGSFQKLFENKFSNNEQEFITNQKYQENIIQQLQNENFTLKEINQNLYDKLTTSQAEIDILQLFEYKYEEENIKYEELQQEFNELKRSIEEGDRKLKEHNQIKEHEPQMEHETLQVEGQLLTTIIKVKIKKNSATYQNQSRTSKG